VAAVTDASGAVTHSYTYDPYGVTTETTSSAVTNPWRYTGQYQDVATGLYKMGARYYQPELGRWTQPDPSGLDTNAYLYVGGNPVNFIDPSGLYCITGTRSGPGGGCRGGGLGEFYEDKGEFRRLRCAIALLGNFFGKGPRGRSTYTDCPEVRVPEPFPEAPTPLA
jgi:RHS repeat-associated protein